jgi:hypothetical protein
MEHNHARHSGVKVEDAPAPSTDATQTESEETASDPRGRDGPLDADQQPDAA